MTICSTLSVLILSRETYGEVQESYLEMVLGYVRHLDHRGMDARNQVHYIFMYLQQ